MIVKHELFDLWAAATRQSPYGAALDFSSRLNVPLPLPVSRTWNKEEQLVAPI
jgi:hypothetical protein